MKTPSSFLYSCDAGGRVATITLNRPERLNALTFDVYLELRDLFRGFAANGSGDDAAARVRAVVITGAGRAFCTGGDVRDIIGPLLARDAAGLKDFTALTADLIRAMKECPCPVVAAVNGTAAGAGAVIAAACDIRIAAESARIAFLFTKVGLSGADMGAAWLLPRLVGLGRASELLLTGDFIEAQEACRIGLYNRVVPDGQALASAQEMATLLAEGPALALAHTKRALDAEAHMDLTTALDLEAELQASLMTHPDFREAYESFTSSRKPRFQ